MTITFCDSCGREFDDDPCFHKDADLCPACAIDQCAACRQDLRDDMSVEAVRGE